MQGRPKTPLVLSAQERQQLLALVVRRKTSQALALRVRMVLACAEGADNKTVAGQLGVAQQTVSKWRKRFVQQRLVGLLDAPRPGPPPRLDTERANAVLAHMLAPPPAGLRRWTTRSLAQAAGVSQATVARMWRARGIQVDWLRRLRLAQGQVHVAGMPGEGQAVRGVLGLMLEPALRLVAWQLPGVLGHDSGALKKAREKADTQAENQTGIPANMPGALPVQAPVPADGAAPPKAPHWLAALESAGRRQQSPGVALAAARPVQQPAELESGLLQFLRAVQATAPAGGEVLLVADAPEPMLAPSVLMWLAQHSQFQLHCTFTQADWDTLVQPCLTELARLAGAPRVPQGSLGAAALVQALQAKLQAQLQVQQQPAAGQSRPWCWVATMPVV